MRKLIFFLSVISTALLITSCMGEGSRNYTERSIAYIATDNGVVYGRTLTGRFITSEKMQLEMYPGTLNLFSYSYKEEYGTTTIGEYVADNIVISGDVTEIKKSYLISSQAPQEENPNKFLELKDPIYAGDAFYLGDHWLLEFAFEAKKGESASLRFYRREVTGGNNDEVNIDVFLDIIGEGEGTSVSQQVDIVALDMSPIRSEFQGPNQSNMKQIKVKFTYHLKDRTDLVNSPTYPLWVAGN